MCDKYKDAGVNIDEGNRFVDLIKPMIEKTNRRGVLTGIGGYGGLFALDAHKYKEPVLVSSTDGVGTKLKLAIELGRFDTIGIDLVAMCVNDIACCGAEPLFFLDYFATGHLEADKHKDIIEGITRACKEVNCALIGGETAEMPGMYAEKDFDLAGFTVGVVEREKIIDGSEVSLGQKIIGIASSGFHSNGYSLVRKIIQDKNLDLKSKFASSHQTLGEVLLTPTRLYSPIVLKLLREFKITAIAHITGGGFIDNIPRVIPSGVQVRIDTNSWTLPPIMKYIQELGRIDKGEMYRCFNCGIGLVLTVPAEKAKETCDFICAHGEEARVIGSVVARKPDSPAVILD